MYPVGMNRLHCDFGYHKVTAVRIQFSTVVFKSRPVTLELSSATEFLKYLYPV